MQSNDSHVFYCTVLFCFSALVIGGWGGGGGASECEEAINPHDIVD